MQMLTVTDTEQVQRFLPAFSQPELQPTLMTAMTITMQ
jgi:hypothetical protein